MKKKWGIAGGMLALLLVLTACTGGTEQAGERSRMVRAPEEYGVREEWLGSGCYETDSRGWVSGSMSRSGEVTGDAERAVDDLRQGAMDAGEKLKRGIERAGQDMKKAVGK